MGRIHHELVGLEALALGQRLLFLDTRCGSSSHGLCGNYGLGGDRSLDGRLGRIPAASPDDLAAVRNIAEHVGRSDRAPVICGLARASQKDIDAAWEGVQVGDATAYTHVPRHQRAAHEAQAAHDARRGARARRARWWATRARCATTSSSRPEDAGRSEPEFLWRVVEAAVAAGATTVNIPDTVGYTTPDEFGALIAGIVANVPNLDGVV